MKKLISVLSLAVAFTLATGTSAHAEDKLLGVVAKIDLAADGNSAVAVLKDSKSGQPLDIAVQDKVTLDKVLAPHLARTRERLAEQEGELRTLRARVAELEQSLATLSSLAEDETEHDVLVLGRVPAAARGVGGSPEPNLEA